MPGPTGWKPVLQNASGRRAGELFIAGFPNHFSQRQKLLYRGTAAAIFFLDDFLQRQEISRQWTFVISPRFFTHSLRLHTPDAAKTRCAHLSLHHVLFTLDPYMLTRHDFAPLD